MVYDHVEYTFNVLSSHILIENYNSSRSLLCFFHGHGCDQRKKKGRGTVQGFTVGTRELRNALQYSQLNFQKDMEVALDRCWHFSASLLKIDYRSILSSGTRNVGCWHTVTIATSER